MAHATLTVEKNRHIIEVTIPFNGVILRGEVATDDMYTSIDSVAEKLERQIARHRTKLEKRIKDGSLRFESFSFDVDEDESGEPKIVRTKRFAMKPMPVEEAVLQMELLGHVFFMFFNAETEEVNVVKRRRKLRFNRTNPLIVRKWTHSPAESFDNLKIY